MASEPTNHQILLHHDFVSRTDRKSLYTQIKALVKKAQEVDNGELLNRRQTLQKLLEFEDKIYEEEFANKVKSRIDEDIQKRKDALLKIKEERDRLALEFVESKKIQQQMESCYEIRTALRHKETLNVKECQLEQMLEKERQLMKDRQLTKYWMDVELKELQREDKRQTNENCLRKKLSDQTKEVLDLQMQQLEAKRQAECKVKAQEAEDLRKLLEEIRIEEFDLAHQGGIPTHMHEYRKELQSAIEKNKAQRDAEALERADEHRALMKAIREEEEAEAAATFARKRSHYRATLDYLDYIRRMRRMEKDQRKMREDRMDDLRMVDICTKNNLQRELQRKAEIAALCHAELRRQICEQQERRLREEAERREDKIIENRFAKSEKTREEIMAQRVRNREGLDKQIAQLHIIRAAEEAAYKDNLQRAIDDPEYCAQLAEEYVKKGIDYLEPHANWRILACPPVPQAPKPCAREAPPPAEGARVDTCIVPCGCSAGANRQCALHNISKPQYEWRQQ